MEGKMSDMWPASPAVRPEHADLYATEPEVSDTERPDEDDTPEFAAREGEDTQTASEQPEDGPATSSPSAAHELAGPEVTGPEVTGPESGTGVPEPEDGPVFSPDAAESFRQRWSTIQAEFVDDPHRAVEDADRFVTDIAQAFATGVETRRHTLASAWEHDGHEQTEELRLTMRQYRTLVDQILLR
jgi:hypothetical protein